MRVVVTWVPMRRRWDGGRTSEIDPFEILELSGDDGLGVRHIYEVVVQDVPSGLLPVETKRLLRVGALGVLVYEVCRGRVAREAEFGVALD